MSSSDLSIAIKAIFVLLTCMSEGRIDNDDFRHAFASLARSFLVEMKDSDLYDIVKKDSYESSGLYQKLLRLSQDIETKTIAGILDEAASEFDIYSRINRIGQVRLHDDAICKVLIRIDHGSDCILHLLFVAAENKRCEIFTNVFKIIYCNVSSM